MTPASSDLLRLRGPPTSLLALPPPLPRSFFPSIGSVAAAESAREPSTETNDTNMFDGDEDDRAVQEIESLCMSCHENVGP